MFLRLFAIIAIFTLATTIVGVAAAQQRAVPVPLQARQGAQVSTIDLAQAGGSNVNVEIVSACVQGVATFKVINLGDKWPKLGKLKVYMIIDGQARELSAREMRFAKGQKASFRLKSGENARIGLFVDPSWYERPFQYDAEVACR